MGAKLIALYPQANAAGAGYNYVSQPKTLRNADQRDVLTISAGIGQQRPAFVTGQESSGKPCVSGTFFNTSALQDPSLGSFGDVSLNSVNGPGVKNWDMSIPKTIPVREAQRFESRGEFYSSFNHPNFLFAGAGPQTAINATVFGSSNFGFVTAVQDPRLTQIGAKFYY